MKKVNETVEYKDLIRKGVYYLKEDIDLYNGETLYAGEYVLLHYRDIYRTPIGKIHCECDLMSGISRRYGTLRITFDSVEEMQMWFDRHTRFEEERTNIYEQNDSQRKREYIRMAFILSLIITAVIMLIGTAGGLLFRCLSFSLSLAGVFSALSVWAVCFAEFTIGKANAENFYYLNYDKMQEDFNKLMNKRT